jgi:hypothetical protein
MNSYVELADWLKTKGIGSYMQSADRLVVSNEKPARPGRNCFWVTSKGRQWFVGTFLPAGYHVPEAQEIGPLCETVFRSSPTAVYSLDPAIVTRYRLRTLTDAEAEAL